MNEKKKLYYRHIVCVLITLGFLAVSIFVFPTAFTRIIESGRDFGLSLAFCFCELFYIPYDFSPTVNNLSSFLMPTVGISSDWSGFQADWAAYWSLWVSKDNFFGYLAFLINILFYISYAIVFALPFVILLVALFRRSFNKQNNDYNKDSKPLKIFKFVTSVTYVPVKNWVISFLSFVRENGVYWKIWLCLWLYNFNAFTIVLELLAFFLYFVISFDLVNIYRQVYKLFVDLSVVFTFFPLWVWAIVGFILFDRFRKKIAYSRLHHFEMRNRGFINTRPIVYMVCGTMGKKKTTAITDMALSQEVMFRDKAFEKILENDLKFPNFPWINLENVLKLAIEHHEVYNLATVRKFVRKKAARWQKSPCRERLFGYDYERYGLTYDDKLKVVNVWEIIETYAQLYFIYVMQSALIISNYSVRVDDMLSDLGNFPMWNTDFFRRDSRLIDSYSRHAKILDFDTVRLGLKVVKDNPYKDSFEFGVVLITEVGKERGNYVELADKKKNVETANQKNDLFNSWLKMIRHSATVDNFPFVRVITDEQRPESWGADARDLCEIVHIRESGETCLTMPFFSLAELLYGWLFGKFSELYYKYRYVRSDNTLFMYVLKWLTANLSGYYTGIYNRFGYCTLKVEIESGTQDGLIQKNKYYLMSKKIYSKRFSTDCFSDFFTAKALRSPVGLDDLPEYATDKATFEELLLQKSYFITDLSKGLINKD